MKLYATNRNPGVDMLCMLCNPGSPPPDNPSSYRPSPQITSLASNNEGMQEERSLIWLNSCLSFVLGLIINNNMVYLLQENNFQCSCLAGFSGTFCEVNIDDCESNPCNNGGNCVDGIASFTCECSSRFMGDTCDLVYDPCEPQPCENDGACVKLRDERSEARDTDFNCTCLLGFNGTRCENNIDDCVAADCESFQQCFDGVNTFTCACPLGFTGEGCSEDIDECASSPCARGECTNLAGRYECTCPQGWTGLNCDTDINECCPEGWEGGECDGLDLPPEQNVCNFGICRNKPGSYECWCKPGYTGRNCSTEYDECLSKPCLNNGTCENLVNDYKCDCQPGFEGKWNISN